MREPLWLSMARMCEGISEIEGAASNPVILKWATDIGAPGFVNDDIAWCAVFMNRLMQAAQLPLAGTQWDLLRADSFSAWEAKLETPVLGAVMVFVRPGGNHVGLYLGERTDAYYMLGGNTSNKVSAAWLPKTRLKSIRWPSAVPIPTTGTIQLADNGGPLSTNEA